MKKYKIYIPIYGCYLTVIITKNFDKVAKKYLEDSECYDAMVRTKEKNGIKEYLYVQRLGISYGDIAHEAKHIVNRIFRDRGQLLDSANDEAECYLLGYIVNEIHSKISEVTKKNC